MTGKQGDPLRAVAYVRVSTEEQANGPDAQRDAIAAWAARAGVRVVDWHEDRISGGAPAEDRPGLLDALCALRASGSGILVAAKRDRLARDVVVAATVERLAREAGARVVTADGVPAGDTPEGALMRTLLDAFAAYERAVIRARTRAALRSRAARFKRHARKAPFGWRWEGEARVEDPDEQRQVREVLELRAGGATYAQIVGTLGAGGAACRSGRWHVNQVRRILARSTPAPKEP